MSNRFATDPVLAVMLHEAFRLFLVIALPMSGAVLVAGLIAASLQGFTRIHDHVIGYSLRAIAVVVCGLALWPAALEGLSRIMSLALNGR